jgi:hypothetical protein
MIETGEWVEFDVELNKGDVEWLDREAARRGCTRNDLLCEAVDKYLDRVSELGTEREKRRERNDGASRTGHGAGKPPTAN